MTKKTKKQKNRMERLIAHLEWVEREEPARFNLEHWMSASSEKELLQAIDEWPERALQRRELNCGTSACVVGHLPAVFPEDWSWEDIGSGEASVHLRSGSGELRSSDLLSDFFGGEAGNWSRIIYSDAYGHRDEYGRVRLSSVLERLRDIRDDRAAEWMECPDPDILELD
jgi:hypothetical protein